MTQTYRIWYTVTHAASIEVEAETLDDAIDLAEKREGEINSGGGVLEINPFTHAWERRTRIEEKKN